MLDLRLSHRLSHRQGAFTLEADVQAGPGVTALFGRSGAGKTTLVNLIAGLERPQRGRIVLDGVVLVDTEAGLWTPPHRRRIGYVFQDARLFPHLSVRHNLLYARWITGRRTAPAQLARIVDLLGIGGLLHRRPGALSGGERQRVAIGRALLAAPRLLLLDEPLAALDAARRAEILPYLERLRDDLALPMVLVSHSLDEVLRLATTLVLLDQGRIAAAGPAEALAGRPDLSPLLGRSGVGGLLSGRVVGQEAGWDLTRVRTAAGDLLVPGRVGVVGQRVRLRIRARDLLLATQPPQGLSARTVLPARITGLFPRAGAGLGAGLEVALDVGGQPLLASITRMAAAELGLEPGRAVWAVLKAVAVEEDGEPL
ncbi:molybdenum ABC transporter ATP-binding protein [Oleisolibacter albus]|uniref:molybdenum ABC transporter ATP-binding protein n=1 Tax=Oleisolibacter albus TaxID=2171757 RepID=UPI000DF3C46F|nr:molybdenum ABC transporter ATP-binding protein [Oleisolibacter albus]